MEVTVPGRARASSRGLRAAAFVLPAVVFVGLLALALGRTDGPPAAGDVAPTFEAPLLEGPGELALEDLRGRPVVVNFWASWCAPCRDEAPMLNAAAERYEGRAHIVGVNIRDARPDALEFAREFGYTFPSVVDRDRRIYDDYGLTGQPETFVIDAEGRISAHVAGPFLSEADLFGLIDGALGARDG